MVNWSAIDTVLLDMDGTLLDLSFDNYFWLEYLPSRYAAHHACDLASAQQYLQQLSTSLHGSLDWYCLDYWSAQISMDVEALKTEVKHLIQFRPGTVEFLAFLQAQGKQAILVTNAHPKALRLKLSASGLDEHIKTCFSSHNFQLAKENTGFWDRLSVHANLNYERCLFIDDSLNVLRCAKSEGVHNVIHVLQPDMSQEIRPTAEFPGLIHFKELMTL
ncbi:MAG: GMP/IMP nucleotidase [Pseudomonadota bacterium]